MQQDLRQLRENARLANNKYITAYNALLNSLGANEGLIECTKCDKVTRVKHDSRVQLKNMKYRCSCGDADLVPELNPKFDKKEK
jgi:hypothetical protein